MDFKHDVPEALSRSQLKREVDALQRLGEELVTLPENQLAALPLPDTLRDAVEFARRITSHGALKRQRQYIGKLMRGIDPAPIRARLDEFRNTSRLAKARFQQTERWRDRLIAEGDIALAEFLDQYPAADRQQLRQLVRAAARETASGQPPRHARTLFRYLQSLAGKAPDPGLSGV
ncbi:MAG TPA: ribosome biogenesis factor YjgA [Gammaproteobacteria bacterium]|nr:ribosome biogenesis factor YjgA [Gammaproteobacteria bacterium]